MRLGLAIANFENFNEDFLKMFFVGFRFDMRIVCVVAALIVIFGYFASTNQKIAKILRRFMQIFVIFVSLLIILSAFVNFYYFQTYHTKIDDFIFGLKNDDTKAVLKIILKDYPVFLILFISAIFVFLCFKISCKILNINFKKTKFSIFEISKIFIVNLFVLLILFVGIRGSVGTFPLREDSFHFSKNLLINSIATNPIMSFINASKNYKKYDFYKPINKTDLDNLQKDLFPVFQKNSQNHIKNSPNIVVVLMESFGTNMLVLDDEKKFDLLMSFRKHFIAGKTGSKTDFTFMNFLSSQNGTAPSFASLFFVAPNGTISLSNVKNKKLPLTPFDIYKKAGYEVIYLTSGSQFWYDFKNYLTILGVDKIYDQNFLLDYYPQSKDSLNTYGVADEYVFKYATKILKNATKPTFIVILTTTNHPPFDILPKNFKAPIYDLQDKIQFFTKKDEEKIKNFAKFYSYANNAFGDFIDDIKNSPLANNTIIAGSGDHRHREIKSYENFALNFAVPLYMYIPSDYTKNFDNVNFGFNPAKIGSHKDIFPTIYALSLNDYEFLSIGGRNLFDLKTDEKFEFGFNDIIWIDKNGIYSENSAYKFNKNFLIDIEKIENFTPKNKNFAKKYKKLEWLQINYRIFDF